MTSFITDEGGYMGNRDFGKRETKKPKKAEKKPTK